MEDSSVTVIVPTYNERDNLASLTAAVLDHGYRVLIVDDASPDGTGEIADALRDQHQRVDVIHRKVKRGLGPAYAEGFRQAIDTGAEIICQMDADFSHDPADLPRLVAAVAERGADVAIGSRYVPGGATPDWPLHRRVLSRGGNIYVRIMLGIPVRDATAGFRAFRASVLRRLEPDRLQASGYGFQVEMALRACRMGMNLVEIPILFRDRIHGESKMQGRIVFEAMWLVTRWGIARFTRLPWLARRT